MSVLRDLDPVALAVFFGAIAIVVAAYAREPENWGIRRIAMGIVLGCAGIALWNATSVVWWWAGPVFGAYQVGLGWSFISRKSHVTAERVIPPGADPH